MLLVYIYLRYSCHPEWSAAQPKDLRLHLPLHLPLPLHLLLPLHLHLLLLFFLSFPHGIC